MQRFFDLYLALGLRPIALYPGSKCPMGNAWNEGWTPEKWRPMFESPCNMGILLGEIVDVEGDTEDANDLLERMIDGARRPMYRSSKSIHNLFINPDPGLTRLVAHGIEFRAWNHMSVVPPSIHLDGKKYSWLQGSSFPIPTMPGELLEFYKKNIRQGSRVAPAVKTSKSKGLRRDQRYTECNRCKKKFVINKRRLVLEVRASRLLGCLWMCRGCRPFDIREACRSIREDSRR